MASWDIGAVQSDGATDIGAVQAAAAGADVTVTPSTLELALTQHAPVVIIPTGAIIFQDDFENNNLDKWTVAEAQWSTTSAQKKNGIYSAYGEGAAANRNLSKTLPYALARARLTFYVRVNETVGTHYVVGIPAYALMIRSGAFEYHDGDYHALPTPTSCTADTWYKIEMTFIAGTNSIKYWIDDSYKGEVTSIAFASFLQLKHICSSIADRNMWIDDVLVEDIVSATAYPTTQELALTQHAPDLAFDYTVTPATLELALTQQTPTMHSFFTALPDCLALALTQHAPTVIAGIIVTPDTFALALTQHAPSLVFDYTVTPDALALALTQHAPTIITAIDVTVLPATLQLALALQSPEIFIRFTEIPPFMLKDLIDPYSGGAWLWLTEISMPGYDTVRKARNTADINYGGMNFPKGNFDVGRQSLSGDGSIPRIVLRVAQDPDHVLEDIVNATKGGADGTVKLIRTCEKFLDTPVDALEAEYDILIAGSDVEWVTFSLGIPNPLTQRIPLWLYSSKVCPLATPSLFKGPRCQYVGGDTVCTGLLEDCYAKGNAVHWGAEIGLDPNAVRV